MLAYEADILDGLYEWTAVLESEYQNQPQIRLTAFMIILTYIWRVTNNHFTALLCNPAAPPPLPAYNRIQQEHLVQGTILHLTALPDQVAIKSFMMPPPNHPATGSLPGTISGDVSVLLGGTGATGNWAPPASIGQSRTLPAAGGESRSQPDPASGPHRLNKPLQDTWDAIGSKMFFARTAPGNRFFKEDPATGNQVVVLANNGVDPICLPYALNGRCYQNCGKRTATHRALTPQERQQVAAAAQLLIPL
jgi:hypothetical protein